MSQYDSRKTSEFIRDTMAKVGYARVSSVGQSLDVQREKLDGCDKLFEEKRSGTTDARPQLKECLNYVRDGDQLIVTRIDRLARSTLHLCQIAETLKQKGVDLVVLDQNIDTSDATGRLLFNMLGAIGQFETEIRAVTRLTAPTALLQLEPVSDQLDLGQPCGTWLDGLLDELHVKKGNNAGPGAAPSTVRR